MTNEHDTPTLRAQALIARLRAQGHTTEADKVEAALDDHRVTAFDETPGEVIGHGFLHGLRDALQTILTAIEAIDPASGTAIEELRLEVDKRLMPHGVPDAEPEEPIR
ncbi:hypothetical protein [Acidisoma cladoniae]|jgi:hypothetical protein|uniref:hypothetical protein n=1 Tax=Acidisoma cladoniae TaxID=3040935 RepID=UPI00254B6817|nr:hypothetical protein [Acidisoma sp. PAMC 29798]